MIENVLSKLVGSGKETKSTLSSIDKTLQKMLLNDQKTARKEEKRLNRERQSNKRKSGDSPLKQKAKSAISSGKDKKKDKKWFFMAIYGLNTFPTF